MFDKTETLQLKGIAVLIMVYYHSVALNPSVLALPALHAFASRTGNICVVIFAFITIYGLSKKLLNASDSITIKKSYPLFVIKRTAALYRSFWPAYLLAFTVSPSRNCCITSSVSRILHCSATIMVPCRGLCCMGSSTF